MPFRIGSFTAIAAFVGFGLFRHCGQQNIFSRVLRQLWGREEDKTSLKKRG
jgi:hypothetical protein